MALTRPLCKARGAGRKRQPRTYRSRQRHLHGDRAGQVHGRHAATGCRSLVDQLLPGCVLRRRTVTISAAEPYAFFHSPGDPELNFEGGLQKIALRSTFTPGTVTVTATAPGLVSGSVQLTSVTPPAPPQSQPPAIIVPPVDTAVTAGQPATFTVAASGSGTLSYQWAVAGSEVTGATSPTLTIPATTLAQNGENVTVAITQQFWRSYFHPGHVDCGRGSRRRHHHATSRADRRRRTVGNLHRSCHRFARSSTTSGFRMAYKSKPVRSPAIPRPS